jgi:hypothetical protein
MITRCTLARAGGCLPCKPDVDVAWFMESHPFLHIINHRGYHKLLCTRYSLFTSWTIVHTMTCCAPWTVFTPCTIVHTMNLCVPWTVLDTMKRCAHHELLCTPWSVAHITNDRTHSELLCTFQIYVIVLVIRISTKRNDPANTTIKMYVLTD